MKVLVLLADNGQDPTEVVVPCSILESNGFTVEFATERGAEAHCDPRMISGPVGAMMVRPMRVAIIPTLCAF